MEIQQQQQVSEQKDKQQKEVQNQKNYEIIKIQPQEPFERSKKLGLSSDKFKSIKKLSEKVSEKMHKIKKKDRTYMKPSEWDELEYANYNWCQVLIQNCPDEIQKIEYESCSYQEFQEKYAQQNKPIMIKNMYKESFIQKYWNFDYLYQKYKDIEFKIGEDDDGHKLRIKFKYFIEYLLCNRDDSPLYLFESAIEDIKEAKSLITKYDVPKYFTDDFFRLVGEKLRPPYRWLLVGPERSGTTVHIDPLNTDAWNTSFCGMKRWVLFPPSIPKDIVKGRKYRPKGEDDEAIVYFAKMLPQIIAAEGRDNLGVIEFLQGPGDTVYVPGGWWHAVVNLTDTIAVTQNSMNRANQERVWSSVRNERKKFACYLLKKLKKKVPDVAKELEQLNERDQFIMYNEEKRLLKKRSQGEVSKLSQEDQKKLDIIEKKRKLEERNHSSSSSSSSSSSDYDSSSSDSSDDENKKNKKLK